MPSKIDFQNLVYQLSGFDRNQLIKDIFDMNHEPIFESYEGLAPRSQFKSTIPKEEYDKIYRSLYNWSHTRTWYHFTIDDIEKFLEKKDHVK